MDKKVTNLMSVTATLLVFYINLCNPPNSSICIISFGSNFGNGALMHLQPPVITNQLSEALPLIPESLPLIPENINSRLLLFTHQQ
jgi:hypothetical protein